MKVLHKMFQFCISENRDWAMRMYRSEINAITVTQSNSFIFITKIALFEYLNEFATKM